MNRFLMQAWIVLLVLLIVLLFVTAKKSRMISERGCIGITIGVTTMFILGVCVL